MPLIEIKNIVKTYTTGEDSFNALNGVSFSVEKGEFVAIMGTSGSGKSTCMNTLGTLDRPTSGSYHLDGVDVFSLSPEELSKIRNKKIGFVFQGFNLISRTSALDNVALPMIYKGVPEEERYKRAREALEIVGLKNRENHMPNQMSGGQQQRVAIARALVNDPVLILADEATGNLDTRTSFEILTLFQELYARGRTIVFVTHNPELSAYSSRTIVLKDGRVIQDTRNEKIASAKETLAALPKNED